MTWKTQIPSWQLSTKVVLKSKSFLGCITCLSHDWHVTVAARVRCISDVLLCPQAEGGSRRGTAERPITTCSVTGTVNASNQGPDMDICSGPEFVDWLQDIVDTHLPLTMLV